MARSKDLSLQAAGIETRVAFAQGLWKLLDGSNGRKYWGCSLLIPKTVDIGALKELALEAAIEEHGEKAKQMLTDGIIKSPFLDGDGKQGKSTQTGEPHEGFPGHVFLRVTSGEDYRPKLLGPDLLPLTEQSQLKSGDYGFPVLNAFTWFNKENGHGITFGMSMFMKSRSGESLGGSGGPGPAEDYFTPIKDEGAAPDETKGGDGAAGFFG